MEKLKINDGTCGYQQASQWLPVGGLGEMWSARPPQMFASWERRASMVKLLIPDNKNSWRRDCPESVDAINAYRRPVGNKQGQQCLYKCRLNNVL